VSVINTHVKHQRFPHHLSFQLNGTKNDFAFNKRKRDRQQLLNVIVSDLY